ncbi:AAA+-type ATPase, SpoVK/Ycf46/Vps4 family [Geosmithia morbida]|uniref:AAA+-type ATPase, SpoVK/Ycf46/Vps4 family n=1 Tax=Geosmithia morbida TaxID=1094350 RepID=A0A9P4YSE2_9HYPO|nr:AAA+-type ATPase, SpoVK/Ycf46/Vps4 family [Geosmithia morbida]KAF4120967.1 AAA+-type ATPase, SpoVK/Ycf46/Vps4 family [Geosmithia morbida]
MHVQGLARSTVALAARDSRCRANGITATRAAVAATVSSLASSNTSSLSRYSSRSSLSRRSFHSSTCRHDNSAVDTPPNPWRPGSNRSIFEDDVNLEEGQAGAEVLGERPKNSAFGPRSRRGQNKRRSALDLPPVNLPPTFLENNVSHFEPGVQPKLPVPIIMDARHPKVSRLHTKRNNNSSKNDSNLTPNIRTTSTALEEYFETAVNILVERETQLFDDFNDLPANLPSPWDNSFQIEKLVRTWDSLIDVSWQLADALYPARDAEYTYRTRPFWWWHIYKDLDRQGQTWRDSFDRRDPPISLQLKYSEFLKEPLAHSIADFPPETFDNICKNLGRDILQMAPADFDHKAGKRPIQILSMTGYSGSAIARSIGSIAGYLNMADVIQLDAYDLSTIVGGYIGQDWVYSRGAVSTMGFRAAELGGRIAKEPEFSLGSQHDDEDDENIINMRATTSGAAWNNEFQKVRQGKYECFTDWENLKINKVLDSIISDPVADSDRPLVVQVHDYVELSMTLEGSVILSKLRSRIDAAWKRGRAIVLLGTSSCANPSDEYQSMVRELGATDLVISRSIRPDRAEKETGVVMKPQAAPFNLQATDTLDENARNINRMVCAIDPSADPSSVPQWRITDLGDTYWTHPAFQGKPRNLLNSSVLPLPEVHNLARGFRDVELMPPFGGSASFLLRAAMGPLRQQPGQDLFEDAVVNDDPGVDPRESPARGEDPSKYDGSGSHRPSSPNGVNLARLNEYEKRIANGVINRENLRTTFGDVHVAPDTIGALKLLTSLALVRPDAFSYGVLAHDKINGCLLYGPPGTGKTMLAKAVAKESGANMLEISGASINDKWVGEAEKLIRAVFTLAKKLSPCVVFIDEADSLLANRSMYSSRASHREHINQFLKEWDGMEETSAFIMVATNRPFDLDDAVLRRLPRKLLVDLPLVQDRAAILRLVLRDEALAPEVDLESLANRTPYYSGSDLKNMCVAAAMVAVEEENAAAAAHEGPEPYAYPERRTLSAAHFERALKQIPASISEDMESLRLIRRFDEEYGNRRKGSGKKTMGFGAGAVASKDDVNPARVRQTGRP